MIFYIISYSYHEQLKLEFSSNWNLLHKKNFNIWVVSIQLKIKILKSSIEKMLDLSKF